MNRIRFFRCSALTVLALVVTLASISCKSSTAPTAAIFNGSWDGTAHATGAKDTTVALHLSLTASAADLAGTRTLAGTGSWGTSASETPLTVISGDQENGTYAGAAFSNISLRVSSPTLGQADLNGQMVGGQFTGSIGWAGGQVFRLTLTR